MANTKDVVIELGTDSKNNSKSMKAAHMSKYGKPVYNYNSKKAHRFTGCERVIIFFAWLIVIIIPIFWFGIFRTVRDYERVLIFRLGKLTGKAQGPGLFRVNPLLDTVYIVDIRVKSHILPPQSMMTKDSVTCSIDAIVFMKVESPMRAILEVNDYHYAFLNFAKTTLRSVIGQFNLEDILSKREVINKKLRDIIEAETHSWGVIVPSVEIKDVALPANMQRAMAAEAEAERERRAKIISSTGEAQAAKQLAEAANIVSESPGALQLRYLHTLVKISAEKNSTILFPLPMEVMRGIQTFTDNLATYNKQNETKMSKIEENDAY